MRDPLREFRRQRATRIRAWNPQSDQAARDPCALGRIAICPFRGACDRDALAWHRARAGNRAAYDALYESWFARTYRIASARLGSRRLAEICAGDVLAVAFTFPAPLDGCAAAHVLGLLAMRLRWETEGAS